LSAASMLAESAQSLEMAAQADGQIRDELVKKAKRERRMADAIYDRARAIVKTPVPEQNLPNIEVHPPVVVPDYDGIEEGPPFVTGAPPTRVAGETSPGTFELANARCQPFSAWLPTGQAVTKSVVERLLR